MISTLLLVLFAYLFSIIKLPSALYVQHSIYVFYMFSAFLMFILTYNLVREIGNPQYVINLLLISNVLTVIYCVVQVSLPPGGQIAVFGIEEFSMKQNRFDGRLIGPFGGSEITSAYSMTMTLIALFEALNASRLRRIALAVLATFNVAIIVATGARSGFLLLVLSLLFFLRLYRHRLGNLRAVQILLAASVIVFTSVTVVSNYTSYGTLMDRLAGTNIEGGVPDTRKAVWSEALEVAPESMLFGHGPYLVSPVNVRLGQLVPPEQLVMAFPHSLYLFLFLTIGAVGLTAMLAFFGHAIWKMLRSAYILNQSEQSNKDYLLLGVLLTFGFLMHEIIIEFLRPSYIAYAHFRLALLGLFVGIADYTYSTHLGRFFNDPRYQVHA